MSIMSSKLDRRQYDWARYIPMRLSSSERQLLAVLENALDVSEYTDNVDIYGGFRKKKVDRIIENLVDTMNITMGLNVAADLPGSEELLLSDNQETFPFFAKIFEIGRRYKIMNPNKMRGTYGKMMYLLMDTRSEFLNMKHPDLEINFVDEISTVYTFCKERNGLDMLNDPLILQACKCLDDIDREYASVELEKAKAMKTHALKKLIEKYAIDGNKNGNDNGNDNEPIYGPAPPPQMTKEAVELVVNSVSDNQSYLSFNAGPVEKMLKLLTSLFDPEEETQPFSLALSNRGGKSKRPYSYSSSISYFSGFSSNYRGGGEKLSHTHQEQYTFVLQSMTLWKEIMSNLPRLWTFADQDMLYEPYRIADTGQGLHRVQDCPRVRQEMNRILSHVQSKFDHWVGLSVVHLGDRDVPNALVFIDKYSQVPNILAPIAICVESIQENCYKDDHIKAYVEAEWGSSKGLIMQVLSDFFKHGFDGSGDDGGSCIDGRLTSAWNWCSKIEKKPFYYVFSLCGFQGFDGDF